MEASQTPFQAGWWSFSLRGYRACADTYCLFPYESLPPVDPTALQGDFRWLPPLDRTLEDVGASDEARSEIPSHLPALIAEAKRRGVLLPPTFLTFLRDTNAHRRIPSCTACYFDLSAELTPSPFGDGAYLIRFLNDQQWVLLWHLYLLPNGDHCVVVSETAYDDPEYHDASMGREEPAIREQLRETTWWCAPSFEAFLYRFWRENYLWFALTKRRILTDDDEAYLRFYIA